MKKKYNMNFKNLLLLLLISIFHFYLNNSPVNAYEKISDVYKASKNAIVKISSIGFGSGILINREGMILTSNRLISGADNLNVKFSSGQEIEGKIIAQDYDRDLAIVWVNLLGIENYSVLTISKNKPLVLIGEEILALGAPINYESKDITVTAGIVGKTQDSLITHDASLNKGNIGGPLLNYDAEIVGINSHIIKSKGKAIGTAIAVNKIDTLIQKAAIKKASLSKPKKVSKSFSRPDYPLEKIKFSNLKKEAKKSDYTIAYKHQYFIKATTPLTEYREFIRYEEKQHKRREKKAKKKDFDISDDEYISKNLGKHNFEGFNSANVILIVEPQIIARNLGNGTTFTNVPNHYARSIDITDKTGKLLCELSPEQDKTLPIVLNLI